MAGQVCLMAQSTTQVTGTSDTAVHRNNRLYFGLTGGVSFSELYANEDWYITPHFSDKSIILQEELSSDFFFGALLAINYSEEFTLQFDMTYKESGHIIEYNSWIQNGPVSTSRNSVYDIQYSNLYFSIIPKFQYGYNTRFILFVGPGFDIPVHSEKSAVIKSSIYNFTTKTGSSSSKTIDPSTEPELSGGIGLVYGLGLEFSIKHSCFGLEFRSMLKPYKLIKDPPVKERLYILALTYRFRVRG